jgi:tetratricopeptide (TPR) repeat protein
MLRLRWVAIALGLGLLLPGPALAGLYNTVEPPTGPSPTPDGVEVLPFSYFRQDVLPDLLQIAVEQPESAPRRRYLDRRDELQRKARAGRLSAEDTVNLSECLIRLRQPDKAIELLFPASRQERSNFMLLANLGTAYQLTGELRRAEDYLEHARDSVLKEWPGLSAERLAWFARAERFHHQLVRLRNREALRAGGGRLPPPETVDDLFGVTFVGDDGTYVAGRIAAAELEKLPPDAVAVVQQLLIWLPDDHRLYWLLGELYNARGDLAAAANVFQDLQWSRRFDAPALREHRQVVLEALAAQKPAGGGLPDDLRLVVVGVVVGLLILVLGYWQVRELFRRQPRTGATPEGS